MSIIKNQKKDTGKAVKHMSKSSGTGSKDGSRTICYELPKQRAQTQSKMFQFMKTKRKGKKK